MSDVLAAGVHEALEEAVRHELAEPFQIEAVLARGSRSIVYAAREIDGGRAVALRVLARGSLGEAGLEDRVRQTIAAATLDHPHIVPIYRFGTTDRLVWYSMKFIEGRSLAELLRAGTPLPVDKCLRIVEQVASAIDCAHRRGVVHGDVRPANVLLDAHDWAFVTDFVIGRVLDRGPDGAGGAAYAAPEDRGARHPAPAADQYALGVTVYECLAGAAPATAGAPRRGAAPRLSPPRLADVRPDLPGHLSDAVERALNPDPGERFPSVLDFVSALSAAGVSPAPVPPPQRSHPSRTGQPVLLMDDLPRGHRWLGVAATVVLVGLGGVALAHKPIPEPGPPPLAVVLPPHSPSPIPPPGEDQPDTVAPALAALPAPEPAPRPTPPAPEPVARRQVPQARSADRPSVAPGRLHVSSRPWGHIYVDGRYVGNTPQAGVTIQAGVRYLRIQRDGYASYEQRLVVAPGQDVRLVDIVLEAVYQ